VPAQPGHADVRTARASSSPTRVPAAAGE
jgi:hypothetical protein